jgi:hyperosmotically inducible periplasmic protein
MLRKWIALSLAGLMLITLFACATPAGRSAGQVIDDSTITTKVKALILEDSFMKGLAISVTTFSGKVTLTGGVETAAQKRKAEEIARGVEGVTGVNNTLEIKKP